MARYIDADKMVSKDNAYTTFPHDLAGCDDNDLVRWINEQPTADVVPKSEVARWRRNLEAVLEEIPETKREVAREIFEEIEKAVEDAEFEWGTVYGVKLCLAELKKKYTEDVK